jgi:hypothetical protein
MPGAVRAQFLGLEGLWGCVVCREPVSSEQMAYCSDACKGKAHGQDVTAAKVPSESVDAVRKSSQRWVSCDGFDG